MHKNLAKIFILQFLVILLILVRVFENLFYDPLIVYFQNDYLHIPLPEINTTKLLIHLFFRYFINASLSILIIWIVFKNLDVVKFSLWFYGIAFFILLSSFYFLLQTNFTNYYLPAFYIRRFLIQPLFLLLLLPAFHYQLTKQNI